MCSFLIVNFLTFLFWESNRASSSDSILCCMSICTIASFASFREDLLTCAKTDESFKLKNLNEFNRNYPAEPNSGVVYVGNTKYTQLSTIGFGLGFII